MLNEELRYFLLQDVKAKESILSSTVLVKLKPTNLLQTIVVLLPEEDSPCIVSLTTLETVTLVSRIWSPGKNNIVMLESAKNDLASCTNSESVVHLMKV